MATCSICNNVETANTVNEMLLAGNGLDVIATATGLHRSSVHRHKVKCFFAWKVARLKARRGNNGDTPGKLFVQWPDAGPEGAGFMCCGRLASECEIGPRDLVFYVQYAPRLNVSTAKNPRAVQFDHETEQSFFDAAILEDQERAKA